MTIVSTSRGSSLVGRSQQMWQRMVQQRTVPLKLAKHLQTSPAQRYSDLDSSLLVPTSAAGYLDVLLCWVDSLHSLSSHTAAPAAAEHTLADHESSPALPQRQMCPVFAFPLSSLDPHPTSTLQSPANHPAPNTSHCPASQQPDPTLRFRMY